MATLDVDHYGRQGRLVRAMDHLPPESQEQLQVFAAYYRTNGLVHADPPAHTRLRRLILKMGSTPGQIEAMRPRVQQIIDGLVDDVEADGHMDVMRDLAYPLPTSVLCELLSVPLSDRAWFLTVSDRINGFTGRSRPSFESLLLAQEAIVEIHAYLTSQAERIRAGANTPDGLLSRMVAAQADGDALSHDELVNTVGSLLVGGHETTAALIGNSLVTLLSHPDQWRLLRDRPSLIPQAVEEVLRYESPLIRNGRLVRQTTELEGKQLCTGDYVTQMLNAANRDPSHFDDPDRFDIERPSQRNLAFGHGIHFCIGAPLARMEAQILLQTVIERLPHIRLVDEHPDWHPGKPLIRILNSLPVTF